MPSLTGFLGNVVGSGTDVLAGLTQLAGRAGTNPTDIPAMLSQLPPAIAQDLAHRYGPLMPGGTPAGETAEQFYEAPAPFLLDALAAAGLGYGAAKAAPHVAAANRARAARALQAGLGPEAGSLNLGGFQQRALTRPAISEELGAGVRQVPLESQMPAGAALPDPGPELAAAVEQALAAGDVGTVDQLVRIYLRRAHGVGPQMPGAPQVAPVGGARANPYTVDPVLGVGTEAAAYEGPLTAKSGLQPEMFAETVQPGRVASRVQQMERLGDDVAVRLERLGYGTGRGGRLAARRGLSPKAQIGFPAGRPGYGAVSEGGRPAMVKPDVAYGRSPVGKEANRMVEQAGADFARNQADELAATQGPEAALAEAKRLTDEVEAMMEGVTPEALARVDPAARRAWTAERNRIAENAQAHWEAWERSFYEQASAQNITAPVELPVGAIDPATGLPQQAAATLLTPEGQVAGKSAFAEAGWPSSVGGAKQAVTREMPPGQYGFRSREFGREKGDIQQLTGNPAAIEELAATPGRYVKKEDLLSGEFRNVPVSEQAQAAAEARFAAEYGTPRFAGEDLRAGLPAEVRTYRLNPNEPMPGFTASGSGGMGVQQTSGTINPARVTMAPEEAAPLAAPEAAAPIAAEAAPAAGVLPPWAEQLVDQLGELVATGRMTEEAAAAHIAEIVKNLGGGGAAAIAAPLAIGGGALAFGASQQRRQSRPTQRRAA